MQSVISQMCGFPGLQEGQRQTAESHLNTTVYFECTRLQKEKLAEAAKKGVQGHSSAPFICHNLSRCHVAFLQHHVVDHLHNVLRYCYLHNSLSVAYMAIYWQNHSHQQHFEPAWCGASWVSSGVLMRSAQIAPVPSLPESHHIESSRALVPLPIGTCRPGIYRQPLAIASQCPCRSACQHACMPTSRQAQTERSVTVSSLRIVRPARSIKRASGHAFCGRSRACMKMRLRCALWHHHAEQSWPFSGLYVSYRCPAMHQTLTLQMFDRSAGSITPENRQCMSRCKHMSSVFRYMETDKQAGA